MQGKIYQGTELCRLESTGHTYHNKIIHVYFIQTEVSAIRPRAKQIEYIEIWYKKLSFIVMLKNRNMFSSNVKLRSVIAQQIGY